MIYLDNQSTTVVDPRVVSAMTPCWTVAYGNAASTSHAMGEEARKLVESARQVIADGLGATPREIVFTSGATESNNLAICGLAERLGKKHRTTGHVVTLKTEHKAVLDPVAALVRDGWAQSFVAVASHNEPCPGLVDVRDFERSIEAAVESTGSASLVFASVMFANNEIGVIQPVAELAKICHRHGVLLHCDATQAIGKLPVSFASLDADLISFTAHKMYGPKGVGALVVRNRSPRIRLAPQILGGGHEQGRRSGTLNVPGIVGFAAALQLSLAALVDESERLLKLRNQLADRLASLVPDMLVNGPPLSSPARLPGNLNCSFPGVDGEALMMNMPELAVSSGSACTSANPEPSHVLRAIGLPDDLCRSSLRFGLGRFTTDAEIIRAVEIVGTAVQRLRKLA